jgi:hypothetical protein
MVGCTLGNMHTRKECGYMITRDCLDLTIEYGEWERDFKTATTRFYDPRQAVLFCMNYGLDHSVIKSALSLAFRLRACGQAVHVRDGKLLTPDLGPKVGTIQG